MPLPALRQGSAPISDGPVASVDVAPGCLVVLLTGGVQRFSAGEEILGAFQEVVNVSKRLPATSYGVEHYVYTQGPLIASPFQQLDPEKLSSNSPLGS